MTDLIHTIALAVGTWTGACILANAVGAAGFFAAGAILGRAAPRGSLRRLVIARAEIYGARQIEPILMPRVLLVAVLSWLFTPVLLAGLIVWLVTVPLGVLMVLADSGFMDRARERAKGAQ